MFASGSMARRASLVAAAALGLGVMAAPSARALEGIQGRHAIFYPSLELVYQHDDNFTLAPNNEISADTFIAHAHFQLEVPGARQYLKLAYEPQYRTVNAEKGTYDVPDNIQHFFQVHSRLRGSSLFGVDIDGSWTLANLETTMSDNPLDVDRGELIRSDAQFTATGMSIPFKWEGSRQAAKIVVDFFNSNFSDKAKAPVWFEMQKWGAGAEYAYKFTPLTRFMVGYMYHGNTQDYTAAYYNAVGIRKADSTRNDVYFGFQGELGRTTTGHASLGFVSLNYNLDLPGVDFSGLTASADITKSFSRYSKLNVGVNRDVDPSVFNNGLSQLNTYYVASRIHFNFTNQPQGGRVGWELAGSAQRDNYDVAAYDQTSGRTGDRQDDIWMARAEIGYHPLEHLSFRVNYRWEQRDSNFKAYEYTDNIVAFQVQFGF